MNYFPSNLLEYSEEDEEYTDIDSYGLYTLHRGLPCYVFLKENSQKNAWQMGNHLMSTLNPFRVFSHLISNSSFYDLRILSGGDISLPTFYSIREKVQLNGE